MVETQDKAIRRVSELKEQCSLEQKAKAHLENALRVELDEKQYKIETLQTQIGLLQQQNHHVTDDENHSISTTENNTDNLELLRKYLNDARTEIENLNGKLQETKANTIIFQSKENDYRNKIVALEKEIAEHSERERENNFKLAQNKMELHNELLTKDTEISNLKIELEQLKQPREGKIENLQTQNKKLIDKVENLTQKCNGYEGDLLKMEQYKIEIKTLAESVADLKKTNAEMSLQLQEKHLECQKLEKTLEERNQQLEVEFERKLAEQRESAKKALLSLETRIKEQVTAEHAEKEEKIRSEFLQRIESLSSSQDNLKDLQTKLFQQEDLNQNLQQEICSLNENLHSLQVKYKELEDNHLELIKEASDQRNKITELNKELEETRNTNNGFEDEVSRLTANLKKLQDVLNKIKTEKQQLADEKTQLEIEVNELKQGISGKVHDYDELLKKFEDCEIKISDLQNTFEELQNKYGNVLDENQNLKENFVQVETLQKQISELQSFKLKSEESALENETLTVKVAELESKLKEYKKQFNEIENQLKMEQQKKIELEETVANLKDFTAEVGELKQKNLLLSTENASLLDLQKEHKVEREQLQKDKEELEEINRKATVNLSELSEKFDKIKREIAELQQRNTQLSTDNGNLSSLQKELKEKLLESERLHKSKEIELEEVNRKAITDFNQLSEKFDKTKSEIAELQERNTQISIDNRNLTDENSGLLNDLSETKVKLDLAQIEVNNYREIADKIASEKQLLLEENNTLKVDFEREKQEFLKTSQQIDVNELKEQINQLQSENKQLKEEVDSLQGLCKERSDLQAQLKELEHQYGEILHEKQLLQDEVQELKTAPLNHNKLDDLKLLQTEEINQLHDKLIQYQSMELTNKSSIEFYQNEVEKLKMKNEKLNRKLDETLVTLNHCAELSNSTEIEYLRNVLFNYMLGKESIVLARVIAAVCKFDDQQTEMIMQKEQQRQSLVSFEVYVFVVILFMLFYYSWVIWEYSNYCK